jgi:hypothetical protein
LNAWGISGWWIRDILERAAKILIPGTLRFGSISFLLAPGTSVPCRCPKQLLRRAAIPGGPPTNRKPGQSCWIAGLSENSKEREFPIDQSQRRITKPSRLMMVVRHSPRAKARSRIFNPFA